MSEGWSILHGPDKTVITLNGKILKDEKEIIGFIDTYMKPDDITILPDPEKEWELMRASNIFHLLFNQDDRVKAYVESITMGVNLMSVILLHVVKRYPGLEWSVYFDEDGELHAHRPSCQLLRSQKSDNLGEV